MTVDSGQWTVDTPSDLADLGTVMYKTSERWLFANAVGSDRGEKTRKK